MEIKFDTEIIQPETKNFPFLVFIHGAGGDKSQWEFQRDFFTNKKFGIITISLPGHGDSSPSKEVSIRSYATNLKEFLSKNGIKKFILVGHSMGGAITLQFSVDFPDFQPMMVVLVGTGAKLNVAPVFFDLIQSDFNKAIKMMTDFSYSDKAELAIKEKNAKIITDNGSRVLLGDLEACRQFDIREDLTKIEVPALIICGEEDQMTPLKYSQYLRDNIEDSQLFIFPDVGHFPFLEIPNQVNDIIFQTIISRMKKNG
jgi:pimeloyl-ACP methyl ester carboxylesterase